MKTSHKLSYQFNVKKLREDLAKASDTWIHHFNTSYYEGEWSGLALRTPKEGNHSLSAGEKEAVYEDTPLLKKLPYFHSVINHFQCEVTSVRLLKLTPGSVIKEHKDPDLSYWYGLVRIHIPIVTHKKVKFILDGKSLEMLPGECWFAEFCQSHRVSNLGTTDRVHLVMDLRVNEWLTDLFIAEGILEANEQPPDPLDGFSKKEKLAMIDSLMRMGTSTAKNMAKSIIEKYGLEIER